MRHWSGRPNQASAVDGPTEGLELIEIAPGVNLQGDVLDQMEFRPRIDLVRTMAESLFRL